MVVGKGGVGKTSTIRSWLGQPFEAKYLSTEVADVNLQVSLLNVVDWTIKDANSEDHLMDSDFRFAAAQVSEDSVVSTSARTEDILIPAMDSNVFDAILKPPEKKSQEIDPVDSTSPKQEGQRKSNSREKTLIHGSGSLNKEK